MIQIQPSVCAGLMEKGAASRACHGHDVSVGGSGRPGLLDGAPVYGVRITVLQNFLAVGVATDQPDARQREATFQFGEVFENVIGTAPVAVRLRANSGQRVLSRPGVHDLDVVNDPVAGGENATARGGGGGFWHGSSHRAERYALHRTPRQALS